MWCDGMDTLSALQGIYEGIQWVNFPQKESVMRSFDVYFVAVDTDVTTHQ